MINCSKLHWLFLLFSSFSLFANDIVVFPMDEVEWQYKGNNLECELKYIDDGHGKFYFRSEERNNPYLNIHLNNVDIEVANSVLYGHPAPWQGEVASLLITEQYDQARESIVFEHNISRLIQFIERGGWIRFSLGGRDTSALRSYLIPTVRIHQPLREFVNCQNSLPLISYSHAKDISLHFNSGQKNLTTEQLNTLTALVSYLKADPKVSKILVDGHTDSSGSRTSNLALSRLRADLVSQQLNRLGVSQSKIEVRAHGSRYPTATNATSAGQAKNRRVTLRLIRSNEMVVPVSSKPNNITKVQS